MNYQAPRGTQDILPEEQAYWHYLRARVQYICGLYGYEEIITPMFEHTELFERGVHEGTDLVDKEMYTFEDKGGDMLTLRAEGTAPTVRAYLEHGMHKLPQPVRLYYFVPFFRYERPQAGRFRQHHQFGVEAIGLQDPAIDLETISVAWALYTDIGLQDLHVQLNSIGCPKCRPSYLENLVAYYREHQDETCDDCKRRLERNPLRMLDCKARGCQPLIAAAPRSSDYLCEECEEHFAELKSYLDDLNMGYSLDHRLVRGLDFYTKTVFEITAEALGAQNAVCGGGRYDGLAEDLGGPSTPGVGFGSGVERIIAIMKDNGIAPPPAAVPEVFLIYHGKEAKHAGIKLMRELRGAGVGVTSTFGDRSFRAQMKQANKAAAKYALIIGEDELAKDEVSVRDMVSGEQKPRKRDQVVTWIKEQLGK